MGSVVTKASSFGRLPTNFYNLLKYIEKNYEKSLKICDVGCLDGLYTIPFLKKGYYVYAYELNPIYLYGGHVDYPVLGQRKSIIVQTRTIYGAQDRINLEKLQNRVTLLNQNFFEKNAIQYDIVYVNCVLNRLEYANIPMDYKIKKLQKAVKNNGLIYIRYLLSNSNYDNNNMYLSLGQMKKYFSENWKILSIVENRKSINSCPHIGNLKYHYHKFGVIKAIKIESYFEKNYKVNLKV